MRSADRHCWPAGALAMLHADHEEGEALFDIYGVLAADGSAADKSALASRICAQLIASARVEEEAFYPALRQALAEPAPVERALAALETARALIRKVAALEPVDAHHDATMAALGACFRGHVGHLRSEVFPRAAACGVDLQALGATLAMRKTHLLPGHGAD